MTSGVFELKYPSGKKKKKKENEILDPHNKNLSGRCKCLPLGTCVHHTSMDHIQTIELVDDNLWGSTTISSKMAMIVAEIMLGEGYWFESHQIQQSIIDTIGHEFIARVDWEVLSGLKRKCFDAGLKDLNLTRKRLRRGGRVFVSETGELLATVDDTDDVIEKL